RECHRRQDRPLVSDLAAILLHRATRHITARLRVLQADNLDDCYADVVAALFAPILDLASDRGDFAQVRFWKFLDALILVARRRHARTQRETMHALAWAWGEDPDDCPPGRASGRASWARTPDE